MVSTAQAKAQREAIALGGHWGVSIWRIRAVATGGTEQGKPAEAGHCSGGRDPAPGVWGHSVPKKPSRTSVCSPGTGSRSGRFRAHGCALSPSRCVCQRPACWSCPLLGEAALSTRRLLPQSQAFFPKHLPGTGVRHGAQDWGKPPEKTREVEHPGRKQYNSGGPVW